jgi:hypothetical protein
MGDKPYEPPTFTEQFQRVPPDILYHYTGQAGLLGIVEKTELWATQIQYMNDATEFGLALRLARELLENIIGTPGNRSEKTAACGRLKRSLEGIQDINIFAVCFCQNSDLLSQWRGYAGGRYGYAIGFDTDQLMQTADKDRFILGPCIYDTAVQRQIIDEAVADCIQRELSTTTKASWGFHGPLADVLFRCGVFFKDPAFADEMEWRLISPIVLYGNEMIQFRTGHSMITPYYKLSIKHEDGLPIRQVMVGPCPHMELAKSAITSLLIQHGKTDPMRGQQIALGSAIPFRNW